MRRSAAEMFRSALHEAGHAVFAVRHGCPIRWVTIKRKVDWLEAWRQKEILSLPTVNPDLGARAGSVLLYARAKPPGPMWLVGLPAELMLSGDLDPTKEYCGVTLDHVLGAEEDHDAFNAIVGREAGREDVLAANAWVCRRRNARAIYVVASALLTNRTLTGLEVEQIVAQADNGCRLPAPRRYVPSSL